MARGSAHGSVRAGGVPFMAGEGENQMSKMRIAALAGLAFLIMAGAGVAKSKPPPLPDVWGRELPVPGRENPGVDVHVFPGENGEMLIYESVATGEGPAAVLTVRRMEFFSGKIEPSSAEELAQQKRKWPAKTSRGLGISLKFPGGYELDRQWLPAWMTDNWEKCLPVPVYGERSAKSKQVHAVVRLFPSEMDAQGYGDRCDPEIQPVTYRTRLIFSNLYNDLNFILPDGTFLAVLDYDFVVRFDRRLRSPFIDRRQDIVILDMNQIEPILEEAGRREVEPGFNPLQFIHDRITDLAAGQPKPAVR